MITQATARASLDRDNAARGLPGARVAASRRGRAAKPNYAEASGETGCGPRMPEQVLAALQRIDPKLRGTQVVILSPTRELSQQTKKVVDRISVKMAGVRTQLLVGGGL